MRLGLITKSVLPNKRNCPLFVNAPEFFVTLSMLLTDIPIGTVKIPVAFSILLPLGIPVLSIAMSLVDEAVVSILALT